MKIRFKFRKLGALRFIGHLDVMRYFQKMIRRAGLPVAYSGGYSPHQLMSFATPLGLGLTSDAEYVDVEFTEMPFESEKTRKEKLISCLNAVNVPELLVLDACILPDDAKNAMSLLAAADYTLEFKEDRGPSDPEAFFATLQAFYGRESLVVTKKTKTGTKEVDLTKQIRVLSRRGDRIFMRIDTGSASNLKPELVLSTFFEAQGQDFDPLSVWINREELYGEEDGKLRALIDYGVRDF